MLKVGVLGVGGISGSHIPVWMNMKEAELVAICDVRPERMDKYEGVNKYTCFEDMVANEKLDILDICLPTYLHPEYSIKAMDLGINVLCEKPISLVKEDVKRIYEAAERNNVKFMVAQVVRFWPEYEAVREAFETKKYGRLLSGTMSRLGNIPKGKWDNWMTDEKRSGLVPYDLHIHDLDFLIYAFGSPESIRCSRVRSSDSDYLSVLYKFDGFFVTAEAAWDCARHPFSSGFRFLFEDALLMTDHGKLKICTRDQNPVEFSPEAQGESADEKDLNLIRSNAYANEIYYFADCVTNDKQPTKVLPEQLEEVIDIIDKHINVESI